MAAYRDVLAVPAGYRSREAALFVAQMDDQSERLAHDTRGMTTAELEWQPAPGMNTIGMLLAHIAIVEVFWIQVGAMGRTAFESRGTLGIGEEDDGIPLPAGAPPPPALAGRDLAFYDDLLARARRHTKREVARLADEDLDRERSRTRRDGAVEEFNVRWVLYHVLEHQAGHYGQILLLRHLHRARRAER